MKKVAIAKKIEQWMDSNNLLSDTRIYYSGKALDFDSSGKKTIIEDVLGSEYFEYSNDDTVSMSFEGGLYGVMNAHWENKRLGNLHTEFVNLLEGCGYYAELGNAWNLSLYKI